MAHSNDKHLEELGSTGPINGIVHKVPVTSRQNVCRVKRKSKEIPIADENSEPSAVGTTSPPKRLRFSPPTEAESSSVLYSRDSECFRSAGPMLHPPTTPESSPESSHTIRPMSPNPVSRYLPPASDDSSHATSELYELLAPQASLQRKAVFDRFFDAGDEPELPASQASLQRKAVFDRFFDAEDEPESPASQASLQRKAVIDRFFDAEDELELPASQASLQRKAVFDRFFDSEDEPERPSKLGVVATWLSKHPDHYDYAENEDACCEPPAIAGRSLPLEEEQHLPQHFQPADFLDEMSIEVPSIQIDDAIPPPTTRSWSPVFEDDFANQIFPSDSYLLGDNHPTPANAASDPPTPPQNRAETPASEIDALEYFNRPSPWLAILGEKLLAEFEEEDAKIKANLADPSLKYRGRWFSEETEMAHWRIGVSTASPWLEDASRPGINAREEDVEPVLRMASKPVLPARHAGVSNTAAGSESPSRRQSTISGQVPPGDRQHRILNSTATCLPLMIIKQAGSESIQKMQNVVVYVDSNLLLAQFPRQQGQSRLLSVPPTMPLMRGFSLKANNPGFQIELSNISQTHWPGSNHDSFVGAVPISEGYLNKTSGTPKKNASNFTS
ncbi:hypothetical protein BDZ97DRAFT_1761873 [Flammula alnicola]|nr:hypothetical protein BDZ97DRAFT_1761873 [Flammula alnicola]